MTVDAIIKDVKLKAKPYLAKAEPYLAKGQEVVTVSAGTLKAANSAFVSGVQSLVDIELKAGKTLIAAAQTSLDKAKADGLKAVAASPIEYLPDGKKSVLAAYNQSAAVVAKTGDQISRVLKIGFKKINSTATKKTAPKKATAKKRAPRKAASKKAAATA